ncbi:hypothetical protein ACSX1A_11080 [Pontibacter sp. MBLB2868]|uniref:hypothetical protein n=1 Tax=Pontibacter sp. MBLB2868 TaxID=3451555 RepID=UPI003F74F22E
MKNNRRQLQLNNRSLFRFKTEASTITGRSTDPTLTTITITNGTSFIWQGHKKNM